LENIDYQKGYRQSIKDLMDMINFVGAINQKNQSKIDMNSEIERALNQKTDNWEFRTLQSEVRQLKAQVQQLDINVGRLSAIAGNQAYAMQQLLQLLAEQPALAEIQNELIIINNSNG